MDDQQVNRYARQFGGEWRYAQQIIIAIAIVYFKVIVYTISKSGKTPSKRFKKWSKARFSLCSEPSNPKYLGPCVRASAAHYCDNSARSQKCAAIHF